MKIRTNKTSRPTSFHRIKAKSHFRHDNKTCIKIAAKKAMTACGKILNLTDATLVVPAKSHTA